MRRIGVALVLACALAIAPATASAETLPDVGFGGFTFSDAQHGWAVFLAPCSAAGGFCARVRSTADGGRVWRPLARLRVCAGKDGSLCWVRAQRVSAKVGFVSGLQTMMTSDGGRTWVRVEMPLVEALAAVPGGVFALTYAHSGCPGACDVVLRRAAVGGNRFIPVRSFRNPSLGNFDDLVSAGSNLYAVGFGHRAGGAGTAYARLSISRDGGHSWSLRGDPCRVRGGRELDKGGRELDTSQLTAAGSYVAALCVDRRRGGTSIALSRDAGRTFERLRSPLLQGTEIAVGGDGTVGVTSYTTDASSRAHFRVALSRDSGRTWRVVLRSDDSMGSPTFPGLRIFGRSLRAATGQQMWRSEDAGATWQETSVATLVG